MTQNFKQIIIFSGTTEGKALSSALSARNIHHTVCVATAYGHMMQPEDEFTHVAEGRLDIEGMQQLFESHSIIVDATHPFAFQVTENIKLAAANMSLKYIRVIREKDAEVSEADGCTYFRNMQDCAKALNDISGGILLTTGSKELAGICSAVHDKSRIYARVLPTHDSIELCLQAGITANHIIAMHGPFSEALNSALISQYDIKCLVTRDSGKTGGFEEKTLAAIKNGASCYVVRRPVETEGLTNSEALEILSGLLCNKKSYISNDSLTVSIIGMGMGDPTGMTLAAEAALKRAELVFGAKRLLDSAGVNKGLPFYLASDILPRLSAALNERGSLNAAVLFSGDIGFYSGAAKLRAALETMASECGISLELKSYPGISSVSYMAARLGVSYSDCALLSLHGRNSDKALSDAADRIECCGSAFVLLSSGDDVTALARVLHRRGFAADFTLGSRLSYEDESITHMNMDEALGFSGTGLFTLYVRRSINER